MKQRNCGMCERREHKKGKGICQICWGSGVRHTELRTELCRDCVCIFPEPPLFCIHKSQFFVCPICREEMLKVKDDVKAQCELCTKNLVNRIEI